MSPDIRTEFFEVLQSGYEPDDGVVGICQFIVPGSDRLAFHVDVHRALSYYPGRHAAPTTTVTLPLDVLEKFLGEAHVVDFRDPAVMAQIEITGDERLATLLGNLLKKPDSGVADRLEEAEERARSSDPVTRIERVRSPIDAVIRQSLHAGRPLVATGTIETWKVRGWSLDEWQKAFGSMQLRVKSASKAETMGDMLSAIVQAGISPSTETYSNGVMLPRGIWNHFVPPFFRGFDSFEAPQIWMGVGADGAPVTPLHRDGLDGFLFHLWGRKKFLLYSPDQAELLYPFKRYNHFQPCWVRPSAPNYALYPLFKMARPIEVTLEPGDVLINPAGWFHEVYALDPVISVSLFLKESS